MLVSHSLGGYYKHIEHDTENMKKYYLIAIKNGNCCSLNNLAIYYVNNEKVKKYYLMVIEKNSYRSMYNLALYYYNIEKNYTNAKTYYIMALHPTLIK